MRRATAAAAPALAVAVLLAGCFDVQSADLFLLTRTGQVKTKEAKALRDALVAEPAESWQGDLAALFLAATFQQLNLETDAQKLLVGVALDREVESDYRNHYDALTEHGFTLGSPSEAARLALPPPF